MTTLKKLTEEQVEFLLTEGSSIEFWAIRAKFSNIYGYSSDINHDLAVSLVCGCDSNAEIMEIPKIKELKKEALYYLQQNVQETYDKITETLL